MKIKNILPLPLAFLLGMGTTAVVRADPGSQQLTLEAGGVFPTSINNFSNYAGPGPAAGAQYLYGLDDYVGVGLEADYFAFASKDSTLNSPEGGQLAAHYEDKAATLEIMGRYTPMPEAKVMPYLDGGVGLAYFHQNTGATPLPGSTWSDTNTTENRNIQDVGTLGAAFSVGVGVETAITEHLVLGLEAAWHIFGVSKATYGTATIGAPSALLRLGWRFGHEPSPPSS